MFQTLNLVCGVPPSCLMRCVYRRKLSSPASGPHADPALPFHRVHLPALTLCFLEFLPSLWEPTYCSPSPGLLQRILSALPLASLALCSLFWYRVQGWLELDIYACISPQGWELPVRNYGLCFLPVFSLQNITRKVQHKCSLNKFPFGCMYVLEVEGGAGRWQAFRAPRRKWC